MESAFNQLLESKFDIRIRIVAINLIKTDPILIKKFEKFANDRKYFYFTQKCWLNQKPTKYIKKLINLDHF